jgi:hypothetical protein
MEHGTNMPVENITWGQWLEGNSLSDLVDFPENVLSQEWDPSDEDRKAAWALYTEIRTRISTQPLHYRSGDEESALDSLYKLFDFTRTALKEQGPACRHFATITVFVLNRHIRPFTAKWHKKKVNGRLANDDVRRQFRQELKLKLQHKLRQFSILLGRLAEGDVFQIGSESGLPRHSGNQRGLQEPIEFDQILLDENVINREEILYLEQHAIRERREAIGQLGPRRLKNLVGICCSGGGIRSSTLCLGIAQRLAKAGLLREIDYLSTVSGGGYLGSFLKAPLKT